MPFTSLKKFTADTGPLGDRTTATDGYFVDMRDLFLYGDQFQNMAAFNAVPANVANINGFALPPGRSPSGPVSAVNFLSEVNGIGSAAASFR